jgi:predicted nuclease of predicted toxin-antitoxin system
VNFVADEGVDWEVVQALRGKQHTVVYVAELSPGQDDDAVLKQANESAAILITADKDFGELVFRQKRVHNGVVLLRLHGQSPQMKAETILAAVTDFGDQLTNSFSVILPGVVRIRHQS